MKEEGDEPELTIEPDVVGVRNEVIQIEEPTGEYSTIYNKQHSDTHMYDYDAHTHTHTHTHTH